MIAKIKQLLAEVEADEGEQWPKNLKLYASST